MAFVRHTSWVACRHWFCSWNVVIRSGSRFVVDDGRSGPGFDSGWRVRPRGGLAHDLHIWIGGSLRKQEKLELSASILVVGSVAFDSVKTPFGEADEILGGSATYFSVSASYFAPVRVVAVVGDDFGEAQMAVFRKHNVDVEGLNRVTGKTFRW